MEATVHSTISLQKPFSRNPQPPPILCDAEPKGKPVSTSGIARENSFSDTILKCDMEIPRKTANVCETLVVPTNEFIHYEKEDGKK